MALSSMMPGIVEHLKAPVAGLTPGVAERLKAPVGGLTPGVAERLKAPVAGLGVSATADTAARAFSSMAPGIAERRRLRKLEIRELCAEIRALQFDYFYPETAGCTFGGARAQTAATPISIAGHGAPCRCDLPARPDGGSTSSPRDPTIADAEPGDDCLIKIEPHVQPIGYRAELDPKLTPSPPAPERGIAAGLIVDAQRAHAFVTVTLASRRRPTNTRPSGCLFATWSAWSASS